MVSVNKEAHGINFQKVELVSKKNISLIESGLSYVEKVVKPNGTIWISGTLHNIYSIGMALGRSGFKIINNITMAENKSTVNLACRCFTHSTETILWARKNDKKSRHF